VAEVPIERVGVKAKGLLIARCGDEATRCRGGATHGNGLGTCHSKGASMVVEEVHLGDENDSFEQKLIYFLRSSLISMIYW